MARPTLAAEPPRALGCLRCKTAMMALDVGAGAVVYACRDCRALFVPPRGWSRAFAARDVVDDLESRVGLAPPGTIAPIASCPICSRQMDRTRFAATSEVVIDACSNGHGVSMASGDLGRAVDYAAHKARIGDKAAAREADAAWIKANNIDPRRHALETQETYAKAASASNRSRYVMGGGFGVGIVVIIRVLLLLLDRGPPHAKTTTVGPRVEAAGAQGAADLQ